MQKQLEQDLMGQVLMAQFETEQHQWQWQRCVAPPTNVGYQTLPHRF